MFRNPHLSPFLSLKPPTWVLGLALPLTIPIAYLLYLNRATSHHTQTQTGLRDRKRCVSTIPPDVHRPVTLPKDVEHEDSEWVLTYERVVSKPVHLPTSPSPSSQPPERRSRSLTRYVRATMTAFSWTPQAFLLWASVITNSRLSRTFNAKFIQELDFQDGDRVNGFWKVVYRGDSGVAGTERVEMALDAPLGYRGPVVRGVVVAGVETVEDGRVVFVNETWMWRRQGEGAVLLEGVTGRWLHGLLAGWLAVKGMTAVC